MPITDGMQNRILSASLWVTIIGMITGMALATFIFGYQGLYLMVVGQFRESAARMVAACGLAVGTALLLRYRADLLDERD